MISQAYIFGALGKAAFKEDEKWYVLDNHAPNAVRDWHTFDNNYLSLADPETIPVPEGKNLGDIRQLLALETRKQEALTLALQLMDTSIEEESLKIEIAQLLGEYTQDKEIFQFLENRLLTTIVPDSFDPSFASNVCRSLRLNEIARIYETLTVLASAIQTFHTAWVKVAKNHFPDVETADTAFSLLTNEGIARFFVESVANGDENLWDKASVDAVLLFQREGFVSMALLFIHMKKDMTQHFNKQFPNNIVAPTGYFVVRVFIADDHEMVIKGLSESINATPGMKVVGMAGDGEELVRNLEKLHTEIDVVLLDIGMEEMDGLTATAKIKETYKNIKVIVITGLRGRNYAAESIRNNVDGYISKSKSLKEISEAIRRVAGGEMVYMPNPNDPALPPVAPKKLPELSPMEQRILCMIVDGMSSKEIATDLNISQPFVEKCWRNIAHKLGTNKESVMAYLAVEYGLRND